MAINLELPRKLQAVIVKTHQGVAEMVRVVSKGGTVAANAWDMPGGGFPLQPIQSEIDGFRMQLRLVGQPLLETRHGAADL